MNDHPSEGIKTAASKIVTTHANIPESAMRSFQRWWGTVFTVAIIHAAFAAHSGGLPLIVSLTSGRFQGAASTANETEQWLGIPFAQPPTGLRRFKPPMAITSPSNTIRNATKFGNVCPQLPSAKTVGAPMSEDCLVLNVRATIK